MSPQEREREAWRQLDLELDAGKAKREQALLARERNQPLEKVTDKVPLVDSDDGLGD